MDGGECSVVSAESKRERLARELIEVSGSAGDQLREGVLLGFQLNPGGESPELGQALVDQLDFGEVVDLMVPIYARHLNPKVMQAGIDFYTSPAGAKMVDKTLPALREAFESAEVATVDELLAGMMEEVEYDEFLTVLEEMYANHMSSDEISEMIDFFLSRRGIRLAASMPLVVHESHASIRTWMMASMEKVTTSLGELDIDTPAVHKAKQLKSMTDIRAIGNAYMTWLTVQFKNLDQADQADQPWRKLTGEDRPSWSYRPEGSGAGVPYRILSYEGLRSLLVPEYLEELPEKDGWGHPYQFALNEEILERYFIGIRCSGRDGRFDDEYSPGTFTLEEWDQDIVWIDGYFVRFPKGYGSDPPADD